MGRTSDRRIHTEGGTLRLLAEQDVRGMLDAGVPQTEVVQQLVATGNWSQTGANEIVRFLTRGPDRLLAHNLRLPRPRRARDPRGPGVRRGSWV